MDDDGVCLQTKDNPELQKLTAGTTVWCTGIKMNPLSNAIAAAMPDGQQARVFHILSLCLCHAQSRSGTTVVAPAWQVCSGPGSCCVGGAAVVSCLRSSMQEHRHAIHVDQHLAVKGSGGAIFALGDAATVDQPHVLDHAEELFRKADANGDGLLNCAEVRPE